MSKSVLIRVDGALLDAFDLLCERAGLNRSEALRLYMRRAVDRQLDLFALPVDPDQGVEGFLPRQDRAG